MRCLGACLYFFKCRSGWICIVLVHIGMWLVLRSFSVEGWYTSINVLEPPLLRKSKQVVGRSYAGSLFSCSFFSLYIGGRSLYTEMKDCQVENMWCNNNSFVIPAWGESFFCSVKGKRCWASQHDQWDEAPDLFFYSVIPACRESFFRLRYESWVKESLQCATNALCRDD